MPELPEVEIARRHLSRWLRGAMVTHAAAGDARGILDGAPAAARAFARALEGRTVAAVERKGKWLRISFSDGAPRLFSHLGMTGKWVRRAVDAAPERWERARLDVEKGARRWSVRYTDPRRFGRLSVRGDDLPAWRELGPDPLADGIDVARLGEALARTKRTIKEALMDQKVLAGVGNIQATEALWRARIDPRSRADALSSAQLRAVARGIDWTIARTIADAERHGDEIGYVSDEDGDNPFAIYARKDEPCPRCRTPIERVVLGGRGTTFCPSCQVRVGSRAVTRAKRGASSRRAPRRAA